VSLLHEALPASTLVVAIDPGKVTNRVWLSTGEAGEVVPSPPRSSRATRTVAMAPSPQGTHQPLSRAALSAVCSSSRFPPSARSRPVSSVTRPSR
jgi:hypothetical protein